MIAHFDDFCLWVYVLGCIPDFLRDSSDQC